MSVTSGYVLSSERSHSPSSGHDQPGPSARPYSTRADTDRILSYYQSADAGQEYTSQDHHQGHKEPDSALSFPIISRKDSTSSSEYSDEEDVPPKKEPPSVSHHRRNTPSEGGSDRRRLHIIQMGHVDTHDSRSETNWSQSDQHGHVSTDGLRTRRGHEGSLALVAPPDASPKSYTHLTPPATAVPRPMSIGGPSPEQVKPAQDTKAGSNTTHQRSASEAIGSSVTVGRKSSTKSPRDVGIIGTNLKPSDIPPQQLTPNTQLHPPLFQVPQSRSPSPGSNSNTSHTDFTQGRHFMTSVSQPILTPEIGQEKEIHHRVAAPIVMTLSSEETNQLDLQSNGTEVLLSPQIMSPAFSSAHPSSYLYYQPGLHAIAGPLPPPPRAIFAIDASSPPPPRPPRLHSPRRGDTAAVRQALQLAPSVDSRLAEKTSMGSLKSDEERSDREVQSRRTATPETQPKFNADAENSDHPAAYHTREGAFPPSTICTQSRTPSPSRSSTVPILDQTPETTADSRPQPKLSMDDLVADVGDAIDAVGLMSASDVPPPTVVEPPRDKDTRGRPALEFRRQDSWVSISPELRASTDEEIVGRASSDLESEPRSLERVTSREEKENLSLEGASPYSPPRNLKSTFANLKRFSTLPRRPSMISVKAMNRLSGGSRSSRSTRTPSPSPLPPPSAPLPRPPQAGQRIQTSWPAAMAYGEVLAKRSAAERSAGYAMKINELWLCDCGLGDWVFETRHRGNNPNRVSKHPTFNAVGSSGPTAAHPQRRHVSRSSMASEATFPRRPDAYTATDLSFRATGDPTPPNAPPPLPYPSLAVAAPPLSRSAPTRSSTVLSSSPGSGKTALQSPISAKSGGGFFASLGRKASVKRDKPGPTSPTSSSSESRKLSSKPQQIVTPNPRPVNISNSPSVPGGPRALPNRMQRSQTIIVSTFNSAAAAGSHRSSTIMRRPSVFGMTASEPVISLEQDPEFTRQVDKLADLLPQADKIVLAGYLRRAGQDILAIGQYLEDEKNGTIRTA